ncbi:ATP-grasp fold amidoligase family protein [Hanstruepera marina]|uniref:ATP-grasp fold amidoligase family protein n=1 Tax=Hanstruepera marina TaxID=2873265 RepID=UPI001CA6100C|nr:ATP-grasp fold amidoligase family protein [Hanstruepera marina]
MLKAVKYLYHNTSLGNTIINAFFEMRKYFEIRFMDERKYVINQYKANFNKFPDLDSPKTLNEKIIWLKLNDRTDLHTKCADKLLVRNYVESVIGSKYLIPLYYHSSDISDLTPENFPNDNPYIIKTNHNSSGGFIVSNSQLTDWKLIRKKINKLLKQNYYLESKEWQYKNIVPAFLVEKLLKDKNGDLPFDYKFHCFNGRVEAIQVDLDRFSNHKRNFYDRSWNLMPFTWSQWKDNNPLWPNGHGIDKPSNFQTMIDLAEQLAKPFVYVRIDLYNVDGAIYFGEITFHHGGGCERIYPESWDLELGSKIDLSTLSTC